MVTAPRAAIADAIVVLGARVLEGGVPSRALRARARHAAGLFAEGAAPLVICSGGVVGHPPAEAFVAEELLVSDRVPRERIVREEHSRNTRDNARNVARILRERGASKVLLVTDPFHMFRATRSFWREGIDVIPAPTDLTARNLTRSDRAFWYAREVLSVLRHPTVLLARRPRPGRSTANGAR